MQSVPRRKVFISYHHERDQKYADMLRNALADDIVDKSVHEDDIDDSNIKTTTIRQKIRDEFIADATVTIVLVGPETYTRKHVDWEIGSSLRKTKKNSRCGLLGILLPNHPNYRKERCDSLIPPRLAANLKGKDPYAQLYNWPKNGSLIRIRKWINKAFLRRNGTPPNNNTKPFKRNRKLKKLKYTPKSTTKEHTAQLKSPKGKTIGALQSQASKKRDFLASGKRKERKRDKRRSYAEKPPTQESLDRGRR